MVLPNHLKRKDITMTNPPPAAQNKGKIPGIVIGLLVFILACVVIPCCLFIVLYLLAPSVGDVFSGILSTIQAPIP
jgi:hypothetical protein